jgi:CRP/FNR family transcriptional regulator, cyclic AMP receptor protein
VNLDELIVSLPIFEHFSEKEKKQLYQTEHFLEKYSKNELIIKEGEKTSPLFIVLKGSVLVTRTIDESKIRLAKLGPGEVFGEMSFLSEKPRHCNVVANEDVYVLKMDNSFFDKAKPAIRDKIKNYLIQLLIDRLDTMNDSILNMSKLMRSK